MTVTAEDCTQLTQTRDGWKITLAFELDGDALTAIARMDEFEGKDKTQCSMRHAWDLLKALVNCGNTQGASFCTGWTEAVYCEWHEAVSAIRNSWNEMELIARASVSTDDEHWIEKEAEEKEAKRQKRNASSRKRYAAKKKQRGLA